MKTFSQVALHYRFLAQDFPTNVHFCQFNNTLAAYAPNLDGVIKIVRDHIELKEQEAQKYSTDATFVVECRKHIAADKEFLEFCEVPMSNEELEQALLFLNSEEHIRTLLYRVEIHTDGNGNYITSSDNSCPERIMTAKEVIEEANMYKTAIQRRNAWVLQQRKERQARGK